MQDCIEICRILSRNVCGNHLKFTKKHKCSESYLYVFIIQIAISFRLLSPSQRLGALCCVFSQLCSANVNIRVWSQGIRASFFMERGVPLSCAWLIQLPCTSQVSSFDIAGVGLDKLSSSATLDHVCFQLDSMDVFHKSSDWQNEWPEWIGPLQE